MMMSKFSSYLALLIVLGLTSTVTSTSINIGHPDYLPVVLLDDNSHPLELVYRKYILMMLYDLIGQ